MDWTDGYVSDIAYTTGFYRELSPGFLTFAAKLQGCHAPDPAAPFTYCELGCGQGFGTNILAAAHPHAQFVGIDFNPAQVANARALAAASGLTNVGFRDESFREAADLPDHVLPPFDFIALHGIYAWISEANRRSIVDFIDRKLEPGGLVYVSYNCMPGWAAMAPFQRLLLEHAERNPDRSDRQVAAGFEFVANMREADFGYFAQNPGVPKRIDGMKDKDRSYLAHEYLNGTWQPLFFTDVAREMAAAKLDYVGSATLLENFEALALQSKARDLLRRVEDPIFRELLKDHAMNQQFRRDIFVKGARLMTGVEKQEALFDLRFAPLKARKDMAFTFKTPLGEATGQADIYAPIADDVAAEPTSLRDLNARTGIELGKLAQACAALTSSGQIHPAPPYGQDDPDPARRLNQTVKTRVLAGQPYRYLTAPAIANGINASDVEIVALAALEEEQIDGAPALAEAVWRRFQPVGRRLVKDGQPLKTDADNLRELQTRAADIMASRLPVWRSLGLL
jgi:predicted O-methyltransferase YrrM